jgi:signal peptidase II
MIRFLWISGLVVALDQASKYAAAKYLIRYAEVKLLPFLNLTLVYNAGAAFGFLSAGSGWQNLLFSTIAVVACVAIFVMLRGLRAGDWVLAAALTLILGGAIGNLIDRVAHGYVIDFIDFHFGGWHFWTFNVADSAITIGAIALIADAFGLLKRKT